MGKIVVVVRRYLGEEVSGAKWPTALLPWVVASLSGPLRWVYIPTDEEGPPAMTIVADDRDLEPLRDDDDGEELSSGVPSKTKADTGSSQVLGRTIQEKKREKEKVYVRGH